MSNFSCHPGRAGGSPNQIETLSEAAVSRQPVAAHAIFVDYLDGRRCLVPNNVPVLSPDDVSRLTQPVVPTQTPVSAGLQASAAAAKNTFDTQVNEAAYSGQKEMKANHE